jgi:hypothetical protein
MSEAGGLTDAERFRFPKWALEAIERLNQEIVPHSRVQQGLNLMYEALEFHGTGFEAEIYKLMGPSGVGKTSCIRAFLQDPAHSPKVGEDGVNRPVVFVSIPSQMRPRMLYSEILDALKVTIPGIMRDEASQRRAVQRELKAQGVKLLIIDETQNLSFGRTEKQIANVNDWIKTLSNINICQIVLVGMPELSQIETETGSDLMDITGAQIARRKLRDCYLSPFNASSSDDMAEWTDFLVDLDDSLAGDDGTLSELGGMAAAFHRACDGAPAQASKLLNAGFRLAVQNDRSYVTSTDLANAFAARSGAGRPNPFLEGRLAAHNVASLAKHYDDTRRSKISEPTNLHGRPKRPTPSFTK